jgi:hypothetical protein
VSALGERSAHSRLQDFAERILPTMGHRISG